MNTPTWPSRATDHAREYVTIMGRALGKTFTVALTQPKAWEGLASLSSRRQQVPSADRAAYITAWTQTAAAQVCQIMKK